MHFKLSPGNIYYRHFLNTFLSWRYRTETQITLLFVPIYYHLSLSCKVFPLWPCGLVVMSLFPVLPLTAKTEENHVPATQVKDIFLMSCMQAELNF